jgi:glycosyltransferase involved in cell wall biosynthesis
MIKVCHISSAHPVFDVRIFHKECVSLAQAGFDVSLVITHDKEETVKGVKIVPLPPTKGRLHRMLVKTRIAKKKAISLDCDIYHLHDPELMPVALKLKRKGKTVIFDAHEDFPKQLLGKPYLNKFVSKVLSKIFVKYEKFICSKLDFILTATPVIRDKFLKFNSNSIDINNFPILGELASTNEWSDRKNEICYLGGISKIRGIEELIKSMEGTTNVELNLAGTFNELYVYQSVIRYKGWKKTKFYGQVNREELATILATSKVGIVTFHSVPNHVDAQPNKMFEYMSAGIPIITSNFPMWKEVVEGNNCGICIDPTSPSELSSAINLLLNDDEKAKIMGQNGLKAVKEKYNWGKESETLVKIYQTLLT